MWTQIILWAVTAVVNYLLAPKPENAQPGRLQGAPVVDESGPIPVLFGQRLIAQPNVVWYGAVRAEPIKSDGGKK